MPKPVSRSAPQAPSRPPPASNDTNLLDDFDQPAPSAPSTTSTQPTEPKPQSLSDIFEADFGDLQTNQQPAPSEPGKISELNNIMQKMTLEKQEQEQRQAMQQ